MTGKSFGEINDASLDAVPKQDDVEIDQQAEPQIALPQIGQQLRAVYAFESFDRLGLDDDRIFDEQIKSVTALEMLSTIDQG